MSSNSREGLTRDVFRPPRRTGSAAMWMPPVAEDVTFGIGYAPRCPASAPDTSTILVVLRSGQRQLSDGCTAAGPQAQAEDAIAAADRCVRRLHRWGMADGVRCAMVAGNLSARGDDDDDARSHPGPPTSAAASRAGERPAAAGRLDPALLAAQLDGAAVPAADLCAVDRAVHPGPEPERQHVRPRGLDLRRLLRGRLAAAAGRDHPAGARDPAHARAGDGDRAGHAGAAGRHAGSRPARRNRGLGAEYLQRRPARGTG